MAYIGASPVPVIAGGTGAATLTGVLIGNGVSPVTGNAVTQYNVLVGGASNAITNVAPSATTGFGLVSNGASANPSFQSIPGASMVFLSSQTASNSASISFTSLITNTYNTYRMIIYNVFPVTDAATLNLLFSTNNGSTWITTNYQGGGNRNPYNSTTYTNTNSTSAIPLSLGGQSSTTSNAPICGYLDMFNLPSANIPEVIGNFSYFVSGGTLNDAFVVGVNTANTAINALQFSFSSGNISSGTFVLYGMKES